MKKILIIVLLFLNCCSSPQSRNYFELPILKRVAELSLLEPPPPVIVFTPAYVIGVDDSISEISFLRLLEVYKLSYKDKYQEAYNFLFDALNGKVRINTKSPTTLLYYSQTFVIDSNIDKIYKEGGIKKLMKNYCIYSNEAYTLNRAVLTLNEINSISYFFFLNEYVRDDDDYRATIEFKKLTTKLNYQGSSTQGFK